MHHVEINFNQSNEQVATLYMEWVVSGCWFAELEWNWDKHLRIIKERIEQASELWANTKSYLLQGLFINDVKLSNGDGVWSSITLINIFYEEFMTQVEEGSIFWQTSSVNDLTASHEKKNMHHKTFFLA